MDRFRCVCTVRCSPRGWSRGEKGTMHEGHRRVSIIVDNSAGCVSLPCYGCSFRKFASPLGLSRPGNSHLGAMVMRPSRYRAPFNPYFRRRIVAVSTVLGPFVFEHRRDLSRITSTRILRCLFLVRRRERIAFDGDAASNEDCVQKWTRRDMTFFADGVDRSSPFTWMFAIFVSECTFPLKWEGTWFQSGVRQPIVISRNELSSKGRCLHNEGDKFLLVDQWVHAILLLYLVKCSGSTISELSCTIISWLTLSRNTLRSWRLLVVIFYCNLVAFLLKHPYSSYWTINFYKIVQ